MTCSDCHNWFPEHLVGDGQGLFYRDETAFCSKELYSTPRNMTCDKWTALPEHKNKQSVSVLAPELDFSDLHSTQLESIIPTELVKAEQEVAVKKLVRRRKASYNEWNDVRYRGHSEPLRKHQTEALDRYKDETIIPLFFEVGTGKSAAALAIAAYKYRKGDINSLLIVAPNTVHTQWAVEQVPEWLPDDIKREVQCFGGDGGADKTYPFVDPEALHIVIVNIDTFSTPVKWKDIVAWHNDSRTKCMIILDEATTIKNINSKRTERMLYEFNIVTRQGKRVLASFSRSVARCILTGTPATNGAMDLWSLMEFCKPNFFGRNWYSFRAYFGMLMSIEIGSGGVTQVLLNEGVWHAIKRMNDYSEAALHFGVSEDTFNTIHAQDVYEGAYKHMDELKAMLDKVASYKLIKDCVDMPEQNYVTRQVSMSKEQEQAYKDMTRELLAEYDGAMMTAANKISALVRLQQISSGFIVNTSAGEAEQGDLFLRQDYEPGEVVWLGNKIPKMERLIEDIEECSKPCIVVTHFSAEAARIYDALESKHSVCLMTGWRKVGSIEEFKEGVYDIMVANIRVISKGLNLQNACQMLFYSNTFSLEDRLQVEGRIYRTGQRNTCVYTDYVNAGTVDAQVTEVLQQKKHLLDYIRGSDIKEFV